LGNDAKITFSVAVAKHHVNVSYIIGRRAMMGKAVRLPLSNHAGATTMPIRQLLDNAVFNPEEIVMLRDVFEDMLRAMKLSDRSDPATMLVAKKIIELATHGERDATRLRRAAINAFSART
jgi:hypothetical protein